MINGIHHIALHTHNWDRMLKFYTEGLGAVPVTKEFSWKDNSFVDGVLGIKGSAARTLMLKAGNIYLEMFEYAAPPPRNTEALQPNDLGYTHFALDVSDIEAEAARLTAAGMTFTGQIPDEYGGIRAIYGRDPEGNIIELQQLAPGHETHLERLNRPGAGGG